ncbi:MAG: ectonucleotide pyrophosphatase/phosphodiesterase [Candidatus Acidiferrales bacterium]
MNRWLSQFFCFALLFVAGATLWSHAAGRPRGSTQASSNSSAPGAIHHIFLVSVDGLKPQSYTEPDAHGLKVPLMREIVRNGAWSDGVQPVMPTVTYPSHTAMATGANPGTSGISTNVAFDPLDKNSEGWQWYTEDIRVPTIWQVAREHGLRTALIHWPVTVGAQADLNVPEYWRASIPEDLKLLRALSTPLNILPDVAKEFPEVATDLTPPNGTDAAFTDIACYAIEKWQPNLLMLHIAAVDHWEHEKGPFSPEAIDVTEKADAQIARLIEAAKKAGIWDDSVLVIVSDHGFAPIAKDFRPGVLLAEHGLVKLNAKNHPEEWKAAVLNESGSAFLYVKDEKDEATRRALLDIFKPLAGKPGSSIRRVITHDEIVAFGGDPDAFLAIEAADGTRFVTGYTGKLAGPSEKKGTHGYFPDRPEMRASMLVYGPAIGAGKIQNARLIDVGPTVARWLGLELTKAEGKPLEIPMRTASH